MNRMGVSSRLIVVLVVAGMAVLCPSHSAQKLFRETEFYDWRADDNDGGDAWGVGDAEGAARDSTENIEWLPRVAAASHPEGTYCGNDGFVQATAIFSESMTGQDLTQAAGAGLYFSITVEALGSKFSCSDIEYTMNGDRLDIPEVSEPQSCVGKLEKQYGLTVKLDYKPGSNEVDVRTNMGVVTLETC